MSVKKTSAFIGLTIFAFLLIYYPPIIGINTIHLLAGISCLYVLSHRYISGRFVKIYKEFSVPLLFLLIVILLGSIVFWNKPTLDLGLFVMTFETIPIAFVISEIKTNSLPEVDFFDIVISAAVLQSIIACLAFLIPSFHSMLIDRLLDYGFNDVLNKMSGWRMFGYSYTMAYAMPVTQACIATIAVYKGMKKRGIYFLAAIVIFLSAVINARVSIVLFAIGSLGVVLFSDKASLKHSLKIVVVIILALFVLGKGLDYLASSDSATSIWIQSGVNDIKAFVLGTSYASDSYMSYATNVEKYRLPENSFDIIFGTGYTTTRENAAYKSDVGYVNDIWYGGIIYSIWILCFFLSKIRKLFMYWNKKYNVPLLLFFVALIVLLAANIKGRCFSWNEITQFILMSFVYFKYEQITVDELTGRLSDGK